MSTFRSIKQQEDEQETKETAKDLKRIKKQIEVERLKQQLFYNIYETLEKERQRL